MSACRMTSIRYWRPCAPGMCSVSIILQNIAQLKALFEKQWESILGNCDEFLYLGGNETSTTS